jgi:RNA polymerase sigma-70 factor (ECF subfamily)
MATNRDDKELLEAARAGDSAAIEELLSRHERQVYRFGLRMCGSEEAAREVLQQTLLSAFRGIRDFRSEARLSTWLFQIARSFCIKERRRGVDEPESMEPIESPAAQSLASMSEDPERAYEAKQMGEILQAAISALPEASREVLILRDVEGLSTEEAAEVVGIEEGALKSRLHRARTELRKNLAALVEAPGPGPGCPELAKELSSYAAQDIDQSTCRRIEEHLSRCERCASECDSLKKTVSLCRNLSGDEVPAPVRSAVRQALLASTARD